MLKPNQFVEQFNDMEMLKFAINFRQLGNLDVRILEYMCSLPTEIYSEVSDTRIFKGNYSELADAISYPDQCNVRKSCLRLEAQGIITICKENSRIKAIVLNKYWMLKVLNF